MVSNLKKYILRMVFAAFMSTVFLSCGSQNAPTKDGAVSVVETRLELRKKIAAEEMVRAKNELCRSLSEHALNAHRVNDEKRRVKYRFGRWAQKQAMIKSLSKHFAPPPPPHDEVKAYWEYTKTKITTPNEVDRYRTRIAKIYVNYLLDVGPAGASFDEVYGLAQKNAFYLPDKDIDYLLNYIKYQGDWRKPIVGLEI